MRDERARQRAIAARARRVGRRERAGREHEHEPCGGGLRADARQRAAAREPERQHDGQARGHDRERRDHRARTREDERRPRHDDRHERGRDVAPRRPARNRSAAPTCAAPAAGAPTATSAAIHGNAGLAYEKRRLALIVKNTGAASAMATSGSSALRRPPAVATAFAASSAPPSHGAVPRRGSHTTHGGRSWKSALETTAPNRRFVR